MKRVLALLLCLTCLLGVLVSCGDTLQNPATPPLSDNQVQTPSENDQGNDSGQRPPTTEDQGGKTPTNELLLTEYTIVYPKKASKALKETAKRLQESINVRLNGQSVAVISDDQIPGTKYEILLGNTSRPISKDYYDDGVKSVFLVRNVNRTLFLGGFSDVLTDMAVQYFEDTYLANAANQKIATVTDYTGLVSPTFELSEANAANVKITYSEGLSGVAADMAEAIKTHIGITLSKREATDSYVYKKSTTEILIGTFDEDALRDFGNALWKDGYAFELRGKKLLLRATNEESYAKAIAAFGDMLASHSLHGTKGAYFFEDYTVREVSADVLQNLPDVSMIPTNVYPVGDGAYVAIFEGVGEAFFTEYTEALAQAGFAQYTATSFNGSDASDVNRFATYITDQNSVDLGYHATGYLDSWALYEADEAKPKFGNKFEGGILFVTVSPREGLTLPRTEAPDYIPVDATRYPTILTQVGFGDYHPNEASNCYIVRLADGSFIVHDAGYGGGVPGKTTADEIYAILKKQAPDPNNIVISAWITSHPHQDHMNGLTKFANTYATDPAITVKQFVHNFADDSISTESELSNADEVRLAVKKFGSSVEIVKPRAGNVLYYANVKFNILYSHEDHLQLTGDSLYYGNASSLVMQMETDDGVEVLFGADSPMMDWYTGSQPFTFGAIWKRYGSFLESYVMTYMHHGLGGGASWETNAVIKPKIVLWPATWGKINGANLTKSSHATYFTNLSEGVLHTTPNSRGVLGWFVADDNIHIVKLKSGNVTVTVYDTFDLYYVSE